MLWLKMQMHGKVKVMFKVIRKHHQIVKSALHLLLLSKHKKFDDDAIAGFSLVNDN